MQEISFEPFLYSLNDKTNKPFVQSKFPHQFLSQFSLPAMPIVAIVCRLSSNKTSTLFLWFVPFCHCSWYLLRWIFSLDLLNITNQMGIQIVSSNGNLLPKVKFMSQIFKCPMIFLIQANRTFVLRFA